MTPPSTATLREQVHQRVTTATTSHEPGDALEALGELEALTNTIAAAQARLAHHVKQCRIAEREHQPAARRTRGIGHEIALARAESPHRGQRHLGLAHVLVEEMPHTMAAMEAGRCTEWRATILAQATACLSLADRRRIDTELMADPDTTSGWGDRRLHAEADALAYRLDPHATLKRREAAVAERHVSLRPVPGAAGVGMTRLSALLPLEQGVSVIATLGRIADTARTTGDPRTRGQVMVDALVSRATQPAADLAPAEPVIPMSVNVVVSDAALLDVLGEDGDQPGWIDGVPLPADTVRDLIDRAQERGLASLRRLYAAPDTGELVAMESRARCFPAGLATFITHRDRTCRTPYCDAPIRHIDHRRPHAEGGPTSVDNADGLCEACNHARQETSYRALLAQIRSSNAPPGQPRPQRHRHQWPRFEFYFTAA
ncbi:HNH endonuclease [Nocardioides acrostichi]|uniref:HNH endonuclease n=1 Tax=Nocardioides acrostichi TaxID=2784339 RepID=A0A930V5F6_9ACTN|nr:HNH endonuclease [Nocardioides acrostichi]MBF4163519.1 HNH endonuclease [Nocardioides acrostichi]